MKKNICSDSVLKKPITRGPIRAKSSLANKQVSIMRKITESESNQFEEEANQKERFFQMVFQVLNEIDIKTTTTQINRRTDGNLSKAQTNRLYCGFGFFSKKVPKVSEQQEQIIYGLIISKYPILQSPLEKITKILQINILAGIYIIIHALSKEKKLNVYQFLLSFKQEYLCRGIIDKLKNLNLDNNQYLKKYTLQLLIQKLEFLKWLKKNLQTNREKLRTELKESGIEEILHFMLSPQNYTHYNLDSTLIPEQESLQYLNETLKEITQVFGYYFGYFTDAQLQNKDRHLLKSLDKFLLKMKSCFYYQDQNIIQNLRNQLISIQVTNIICQVHNYKNKNPKSFQFLQSPWQIVLNYLIESYQKRQNQMKQNPKKRQRYLLNVLKILKSLPQIKPTKHLLQVYYIGFKLENFRQEVKLNKQQDCSLLRLETIEFFIMVKLYQKLNLNKYKTQRSFNKAQQQKLNQENKQIRELIYKGYNDLLNTLRQKNKVLSTIILLFYPYLHERNYKIIQYKINSIILQPQDLNICILLHSIINNKKEFQSFDELRKEFIGKIFNNITNTDQILKDEIYINCFQPLIKCYVEKKNSYLKQAFNFQRWFLQTLNRIFINLKRQIKQSKLTKEEKRLKVFSVLKTLSGENKLTSVQTLQQNYNENNINQQYMLQKQEDYDEKMMVQLLKLQKCFMKGLFIMLGNRLSIPKDQKKSDWYVLHNGIIGFMRSLYCTMRFVSIEGMQIKENQQQSWTQKCRYWYDVITVLTRTYQNIYLQNRIKNYQQNDEYVFQIYLFSVYQNIKDIQLIILENPFEKKDSTRVQQFYTYMRVFITKKNIEKFTQSHLFQPFYTQIKNIDYLLHIQSQCLRQINTIMNVQILLSLQDCQYIRHPQCIIDQIKSLLKLIDNIFFTPLQLQSRIKTDIVETLCPLKLKNNRQRQNQIKKYLNFGNLQTFDFFASLIKLSKIIRTSNRPFYSELINWSQCKLNPQTILLDIEQSLLTRQFIYSALTEQWLQVIIQQLSIKNLILKYLNDYKCGNYSKGMWQQILATMISKYFQICKDQDLHLNMEKYIKRQLCLKLCSLEQKELQPNHQQINVEDFFQKVQIFDRFHFKTRIHNFESKIKLNIGDSNSLITINCYILLNKQIKQRLLNNSFGQNIQIQKTLISQGNNFLSKNPYVQKDANKIIQKCDKVYFAKYVIEFCQCFINNYIESIDIQFVKPSVYIEKTKYNKFVQFCGFSPVFNIDIITEVITVIVNSSPSFYFFTIFAKFLLLNYHILQSSSKIQNPLLSQKKEYLMDLHRFKIYLSLATMLLTKKVNQELKEVKITKRTDQLEQLRISLILMPLIQKIQTDVSQQQFPKFIQIIDLLSQNQLSKEKVTQILKDSDQTKKVLQLLSIVQQVSYESYNKQFYNLKWSSPQDCIRKAFVNVITTQSQKFFTGLIQSYIPKIDYNYLIGNKKDIKSKQQIIQPQTCRTFSIYIRLYISILEDLLDNKEVLICQHVLSKRFIDLLNCIELVYETLFEYLHSKTLPLQIILDNISLYKQLHKLIHILQTTLQKASKSIKPSQFQSKHKKKSIYNDLFIFIRRIFDNLIQKTQQNKLQLLNPYQQKIIYCSLSKKLRSKKSSYKQFLEAWKIYINAFQGLQYTYCDFQTQSMKGFILCEGFLSGFCQFLERNDHKIPFQKKISQLFTYSLPFIDVRYHPDNLILLETVLLGQLKIITLFSRIATKIIENTNISQVQIKNQTQDYAYRLYKMKQACHLIVVGILCSSPLFIVLKFVDLLKSKILRKFQAQIVFKQLLKLVRTSIDHGFITKEMLQHTLPYFSYSYKLKMNTTTDHRENTLLEIIKRRLIQPACLLIQLKWFTFEGNNKYDKLNKENKLFILGLPLVFSQISSYGYIIPSQKQSDILSLMYFVSNLQFCENYLGCLQLFYRVTKLQDFQKIKDEILKKNYQINRILQLVRIFYKSFFNPIKPKNNETQQQRVKSLRKVEQINRASLESLHQFQYSHTNLKIQVHPFILELTSLPGIEFFKKKCKNIIKMIISMKLLDLNKSQYDDTFREIANYFDLIPYSSRGWPIY